MKKQHRIMFRRNGTKVMNSIRRQLHGLGKRPKEFLVMDHIIKRPSWVRLCDGRFVEYTGP